MEERWNGLVVQLVSHRVLCWARCCLFYSINDFPEIVKSHCKLFEDGAKINKKKVNNVEYFEDIHGDL